jgi:hypothetical protein
MNKYCQKCNQSNPFDAVFCLNCATPLSNGQFGGNQQGNQQWNQPNFGGQPMGGNFTPSIGQSTNASQRATTAGILGLVGLFCLGPIAGIPAAILGFMELNAIKQGQSSPSGKSMASIGFWCGLGGSIVQIGGFLLWILLALAASSENY